MRAAQHGRPPRIRNLNDDRNVAGMPALCALLGVAAPLTVTRYASYGKVDPSRRFDPLRLLSHPTAPTVPFQRRDRVTAWRLRTLGTDEQKAALAIVSGYEAIGELADCSAEHARKLAGLARDPLPVFRDDKQRNPATGRHEVWAYADAVRDWVAARVLPYQLAGGPTTREDVCPPRKTPGKASQVAPAALRSAGRVKRCG